jgi:hypothetical protein
LLRRVARSARGDFMEGLSFELIVEKRELIIWIIVEWGPKGLT